MERNNWCGYSSGSDDDTSGYEIYEIDMSVEAPICLKKEYDVGAVLYPVRMKDCGSTYSSILYDVEGNPLKNLAGEYLNVNNKDMQAAFDNGSLRLIHCMKEPTFRYFITSTSQMQKFKTHREIGAPYKTTYHVYVDDDVDRKSRVYRQVFSSPNLTNNV